MQYTENMANLEDVVIFCTINVISRVSHFLHISHFIFERGISHPSGAFLPLQMSLIPSHVLFLPSHVSFLQTSQSRGSPWQNRPSWSGAGWEHVRSLNLSPTPQVLLHSDQPFQVPQFPSTVKKFSVGNGLKNNFLFMTLKKTETTYQVLSSGK